MKIFLFFLIFFLFVTGCSPQRNATQYVTPAPTAPCVQTVNVVSSPSNVLVEVDDDIKGKTPIVLTFECYKDPVVAALTRQPFSSDPGHHVIRAIPNIKGNCTQTKFVLTKNLPKNIYFQMNLCPVSNKVELNVIQ